MRKKKLLLCLGTNFDQERNMEKARTLLSDIFGNVVFSQNLWTAPIGAGTSRYLNCLASTTTALGRDTLHGTLKQAEHALGRTQAEKEKNIIRIDIDVLQYDDQKLHLHDWQRDYVRQLLQQLQA